MTIFSREELDTFNISQLRRLAIYFNLEYNEKTPKGELIEKIYKRIEQVDDVHAGKPPASVRVRRIREGQKEK